MEIDKYKCASVYGLGYVGLTLCVAWLRAGFRVIGVDILEEKVKALNSGAVSDIEAGVKKEILTAVNGGKFQATLDGIQASKQSEIKIIAVPVGLSDKGQPLLKGLEEAVKTLSQGLKADDVIILESSVPPGTTINLIKPIIEEVSKLKAESDFYLAYSPERIYVGRAIEDLEERYPKIIGGIGPKSNEVVSKLYSKIAKKGVRVVSSPTVAETEKLAEGVYRDVNIALANELAIFASKIGVDYNEIEEVANSQPYCHLHKPGIGVGGACIPIYPLFLMDAAKKVDTNMGLTCLARKINHLMPNYTANLTTQMASILHLNLKSVKVAILGLAFRGGVDDTRLSPTYELINSLVKLGIKEIIIHDPYVSKDSSLGKVGFKLTKKLNEALKDANIIIIASDHPEYKILSLKNLKKMSRGKIGVIDGRHIIKDWETPPKDLAYTAIGRPFKINL